MRKILVLAAGLCATALPASAQQPKAWAEPAQPFEIVEGIYYVGTKGLASYLIVSGGKAVLLDGTLAENVDSIERNIRSLGFGLDDVDVIINSHAHFDHAAGIAQLKADTGAEVAAMAEERSALERGRHEGDNKYGATRFPPVAVDRVLKDGDVVSVGDINLTAMHTPGHTKGCTSWATSARHGGATLKVVFPCSLTVAGNRLANNKGHPSIVEDYRKSFERLRSTEADIVLPAHPEFVDLFGRKAKRAAGAADAFVDRTALQKLVETSRAAFEKELKAARK